MIESVPRPAAIEASMNGSRRTTCVAERERRTKRGNNATAMAITAL